MANDDLKPENQLYSRLYIEKATNARDSKRARVRLHGYYQKLSNYARESLSTLIKSELGISGASAHDYQDFFEKAELHDVLDALTLYHGMLARSGGRLAAEWRELVQRVFDEQALPYRIDRNGIVHPTVDLEFERNRQATLQGLEAAGLNAARQSLDAGFNSLRIKDADTLAMVRHAFDALENHMKSKFDVARLGTKEIEKHIRPLVTERYDGRAKEAAMQLVTSYAKIVDAAHQYRHADGEPDPTPPPLELAIAFLALSAAFLRLLLDVTRSPNS